MIVLKLGTIEVYGVGILECVAVDMVEIMEDCDLLGKLGGTEYDKIQRPYEEAMGSTLISTGIYKTGYDEGAGPLLSGGYFECSDTGESDPLYASKVKEEDTRQGPEGGNMGTIHIAVYRIKLGDDEGADMDY